MESYTPKFIELEGKLNAFHKHTWGKSEKPLWLTNCVYRDSSASRERDGILMLTRCALYIFRNKLMKGYKLRHHDHLLKFTKIEQLPGRVLLRYNRENKIFAVKESPRLKSDEVPLCIDKEMEEPVEEKVDKKNEGMLSLEIEKSEEFCILYDLLVKNLIYGVPEYPHPEFTFSSSVQLYDVDKRPKFSLWRRAMYMAHVDLPWGKNIGCSRYFRAKWKGDNVLKIGTNFYPNYYARPFGEAVGLEVALDTVCFRTSSFKETSTFLNGILRTSVNIDKIVFVDYEVNNKFEFKFEHEKTHVSTWQFINCCSKIITDFIYATELMAFPPKEIAIARRAFNDKDIGNIMKALCGESIETLQFVDLRFRKFPFKGFSFLLGEMPNLETLVLRNINTDGNKLLASIATVIKNPTNVKNIKLQKLLFKTELPEDFKLPETVESIDISESEFVGKSLFSLLTKISQEKLEKPIVFKAEHIKATEIEFQYMKKIKNREFNSLFNPCIGEFVLTSCFLPVVCIEQIFRFLKCQTCLTQLTIRDIDTDSPDRLADLINNLYDRISLKGIDISCRLSTTNAISIVERSKHCSSLERFCMTNTNSGNRLVEALIDFIENTDHVRVFSCDGCTPTPLTTGEKHPVIRLWQTVANLIKEKSIVACDFPYKDIATLGYTLETLPDLYTNWVDVLTNPDLPHTSDHEEILLSLSKLKAEEGEDDDDEFDEFSYSTEMTQN